MIKLVKFVKRNVVICPLFVILYDNWSILFHCYQFTSYVVIMKLSLYKMYNRDRRAIAPLHKEESNLDGTIGVAAIGTMGTKATMTRLSIRNQKVLKY